jgi:transcriptional regulator GlxA family with amidase domain
MARPHTFGFFLVPDFALLPFASATDALRVANWVSGEKLYDWRFITEDGKPVASSNGIPVAAHLARDEATQLDDVVVVAGGRTAVPTKN